MSGWPAPAVGTQAPVASAAAGPTGPAPSDVVGDLAEQGGLGLGPDDLRDDLATGEDVQRRDEHDPVLLRSLRFSSMLSLTTSILSACSLAISSRTGATWRHGPPHSAQ